LLGKNCLVQKLNADGWFVPYQMGVEESNFSDPSRHSRDKRGSSNVYSGRRSMAGAERQVFILSP
jgi:hypothetical protein